MCLNLGNKKKLKKSYKYSQYQGSGKLPDVNYHDSKKTEAA
jgi:hypothetical protein